MDTLAEIRTTPEEIEAVFAEWQRERQMMTAETRAAALREWDGLTPEEYGRIARIVFMEAVRRIRTS